MDSHSHSQSQSQGHIDIDALLERYLSLLDEYTALRETLSSLQRDMYQGLARANFSAERGIRRYGADHYDQRMQAVRRVEITSSSSKDCPSERGAEEGDVQGGVGGFKISVPPVESESESEHEDDGGDGDGEKVGGAGGEDGRESENTNTEELAGKEEKKTQQKKKKKKKKSNDPLRWFGLITPVPLRQAQTNAIKAVEEIIPRLASVNMAMAEVELEVRRARKKRAKAAAAAAAAEKAGRAGKAEVEPGAGEEVQAAA